MPLSFDTPKEWHDGLTVLYDGECPFCSNYAEYARLRSIFEIVRLIDARQDMPLYKSLLSLGLDLDDGMAAIYRGKLYHGGEAVSFLAQNSTDHGLIGAVFNRVFRSDRASRRLYPLLRMGRNATLRLLGKRKITAPRQKITGAGSKSG